MAILLCGWAELLCRPAKAPAAKCLLSKASHVLLPNGTRMLLPKPACVLWTVPWRAGMAPKRSPRCSICTSSDKPPGGLWGPRAGPPLH